MVYTPAVPRLPILNLKGATRLEQSDPPDTENLDDSSRTHQRPRNTKWELSTEALNKLLDYFSVNSEEASIQYLSMQVKLVRYFEWRSCGPSSEDLAQETMSRVTRRIDEGENVTNLQAYFFSVARLVFMEYSRERPPVPLDEVPEFPADEQCEDEQKEDRLRCLDRCLDELSVESRSLILKYYHDEKRAKIDYRKQLANALGIPLNALRIRAHRIRTALEKCVRECLTHPA